MERFTKVIFTVKPLYVLSLVINMKLIDIIIRNLSISQMLLTRKTSKIFIRHTEHHVQVPCLFWNWIFGLCEHYSLYEINVQNLENYLVFSIINFKTNWYIATALDFKIYLPAHIMKELTQWTRYHLITIIKTQP